MGRSRGTGLGKQQVEGLADGIACALSGRRANTAEWQAVLPRRHVDDKSKERYVRRRLAHPLISPLRVMPGFIPEMAEMAGSNGKSIMLPMEQSRIADGFACLLLSIRPGERALPLTGEVRETCASSSSRLDYRVEPFELNPRLGGGELPINGLARRIAFPLP